MAVVYASKNAAGIARSTTGAFTGDGTVTEVILGYRPKYIKVINITDRIVQEKLEGMADDTCLNIVAAGTATANTSSLVTIQDNGFTLAAAVAIDEKAIVWLAS